MCATYTQHILAVTLTHARTRSSEAAWAATVEEKEQEEKSFMHS